KEFLMRRLITLSLIALALSSTPLFAQRFRLRPVFTPLPIVGPNVSFVSMLPAGSFVHTVQANLNISTRAFAPSPTGNSLLTGQGLFMPAGGTFVPALNGNFIVTTREAFDPKTRKFVPSPTGGFVFSTRGDL